MPHPVVSATTGRHQDPGRQRAGARSGGSAQRTAVLTRRLRHGRSSRRRSAPQSGCGRRTTRSRRGIRITPASLHQGPDQPSPARPQRPHPPREPPAISGRRSPEETTRQGPDKSAHMPSTTDRQPPPSRRHRPDHRHAGAALSPGSTPWNEGRPPIWQLLRRWGSERDRSSSGTAAGACAMLPTCPPVSAAARAATPQPAPQQARSRPGRGRHGAGSAPAHRPGRAGAHSGYRNDVP